MTFASLSQAGLLLHLFAAAPTLVVSMTPLHNVFFSFDKLLVAVRARRAIHPQSNGFEVSIARAGA